MENLNNNILGEFTKIFCSTLYFSWKFPFYVKEQYLTPPHKCSYYFLFGVFKIQPFLQKVAKKATFWDFEFYFIMLQRKSYVPHWMELNHVYTSFSAGGSEFSHFFAKINQKSHILIFWISFCYSTNNVLFSTSNGIKTMCIPFSVCEIQNSAVWQKK